VSYAAAMILSRKKAIVSDINQHHEKKTILTFCAVKRFIFFEYYKHPTKSAELSSFIHYIMLDSSIKYQ